MLDHPQRISYTPPPFRAPNKPALRGQLSKAWDYLANRQGSSTAAEFDDDFQPVGPDLRAALADYGVIYSTSGTTTLMLLPEH